MVGLGNRGWLRVAADPRIAVWAAAAAGVARRVVGESDEPWRCGGTWFVGVDALPNRADGSVAGVQFPWQALPLARQDLHQGQLSVIRPGYPARSDEETEAAFGYRLRRDAAHLDGMLLIGAERARMVKDPHAWILGLPLNDCTGAPLVVWEGSHLVMRAALTKALAGQPLESWGAVDLSGPYQAARRRVFESCHRVELPARPGEATLIHRLALHGVAPWQAGLAAPVEGRMIAYFRPKLSSVAEWLGEN